MSETLDEARLSNAQYFEWLSNGMTKRAEDAISSFTRLRVREDGFLRKILPALPITNEELDRRVDDASPWKVVDIEVPTPAAKSLPFMTQPDSTIMQGARYAVQFSRVVSERFIKDAAELRTWQMDIRQVVSDNSTKDILAEEDSKLIGAANSFMIGPDQTVPFSGGKHWRTIRGGLDRDSLQDAFKTLPMLSSSLTPEKVLCNNITIYEIMKGTRNEFGGDLAQNLFEKGWTLERFMNADWIITIKRDLVPDQSIYMWAAPKFLGKFYELQAPTMWIKREHFLLEFFLYEEIGSTLANPNAFGRADFV